MRDWSLNRGSQCYCTENKKYSSLQICLLFLAQKYTGPANRINHSIISWLVSLLLLLFLNSFPFLFLQMNSGKYLFLHLL